MKKFILVIQAALLCCSLNIVAKENLDDGINLEQDLYASVVKREKLRKQLALELAPIRNYEELTRVLGKASPLDLLTESAKQRFVNSIVFGVNGVGSFSFKDLEAELTPTQIYKILSMFGVQHTVSQFENARIESATDAMLMNSGVEQLKSQITTYSFGSGNVTKGQDHKGYYCSGRATCSESQGKICMSGC